MTKATLDAKLFRKAFSAAAKACPEMSPREAYKAVLLDVPEHGSGCPPWVASLSATDGEIEARIPLVGIRYDGYGGSFRVLLPAKWTGDILKAMGRDLDSLALEVDPASRRLTLRAGSSRWTISTLDPALFPEFPAVDAGPAIEVDAADWRKAIRRTSYAAASDQSHGYALAGVKAEWTEDTLTLVGFDGYRLARQEVPCVALKPSGASPQILPSRLAAYARDAVEDASGPVQLSFPGESSFRLECDGVMVSGRLLEGRYPDWADVLARHAPTVRVVAPALPLRSRIEQAVVAPPRDTNRLDLVLSPGSLAFASPDDGVASGEASLEVEHSGRPVATSVSGKLLSAPLATLGPEDPVEVAFCGQGGPVVFRADGLTHLTVSISVEAES